MTTDEYPTWIWRGDGLPPARVFGDPPIHSYRQFQKADGICADADEGTDMLKVYDDAGNRYEAVIADDLQAELDDTRTELAETQRQLTRFSQRIDNEFELIRKWMDGQERIAFSSTNLKFR